MEGDVSTGVFAGVSSPWPRRGRPWRSGCLRGPRRPAAAASLGGQVAAGLARAHAAGIVHGNLRPANVRVSVDGQARILDLGLAELRPGPPSPPTSARSAPCSSKWSPAAALPTWAGAAAPQALLRSADRAGAHRRALPLHEVRRPLHQRRGDAAGPARPAWLGDAADARPVHPRGPGRSPDAARGSHLGSAGRRGWSAPATVPRLRAAAAARGRPLPPPRADGRRRHGDHLQGRGHPPRAHRGAQVPSARS